MYLSDLIREEEKRSSDEAYTKPVSRGEGLIIDPMKELMISDAMQYQIPEIVGESDEGNVGGSEGGGAGSGTIAFYDPLNTIFVDPSFCIYLPLNYCLTFKLSLTRYTQSSIEPCKCLLSMLNRARSKPVFLGYL